MIVSDVLSEDVCTCILPLYLYLSHVFSNVPHLSTSACPRGMVYLSCGPVCPATCANPTPPEGCPTNCMTGCFCPPNTVEYYGECITLSNCTSFTPAPPRPPTIVDTNITSGWAWCSTQGKEEMLREGETE